LSHAIFLVIGQFSHFTGSLKLRLRGDKIVVNPASGRESQRLHAGLRAPFSPLFGAATKHA
jgi:hypothetical protein